MNCPKHPDKKLVCPSCREAGGGKARAVKCRKKELRKWARMGGRPRNEAERAFALGSLAKASPGCARIVLYPMIWAMIPEV
jgi:hypothetical protein